MLPEKSSYNNINILTAQYAYCMYTVEPVYYGHIRTTHKSLD